MQHKAAQTRDELRVFVHAAVIQQNKLKTPGSPPVCSGKSKRLHSCFDSAFGRCRGVPPPSVARQHCSICGAICCLVALPLGRCGKSFYGGECGGTMKGGLRAPLM